MANFSTNQVRHLYVATEVKAPASATQIGAINPKSDDDKTHWYFEYNGAGGVTKSDLIDTKNVTCIKRVPAAKTAPKLKSIQVGMSDEHGTTIVQGQDYILRIVIRQFAGMSDEDVYVKYGAVHATKATTSTALDLLKRMAMSLAKNFSRELTPLFKFKIGDTYVTANTKFEDLASETSATALVIEEVEQEWNLGTKASESVYFDVIPTTVTIDGDEVVWGKITEGASTTLKNGKKMADLEYFCMGERGDIYRNVGWPNVIPTTYLVDPTKDYDTLEIHYYYEGGGENPQKSEKDITIVAEPTVMTALVIAVESASGKAVKEVS